MKFLAIWLVVEKLIIAVCIKQKNSAKVDFAEFELTCSRGEGKMKKKDYNVIFIGRYA